MGTSNENKQRWARIWAASQLKLYTADEILDRLERFRTFYVNAWQDCLQTGDIYEANHFYTMIRRITSLFVDIDAEKSIKEVAVAQAVMRVPLMLAPMESLDFSHLLDDNVEA